MILDQVSVVFLLPGDGEWQVPSLCLESLREEAWEAARLLAA